MLPRTSLPDSTDPRRRKAGGFSLIELLAVIAIFALIAYMSRGVVVSMTNSDNVSRQATILSNIFDLARNEAMARNTYVWVGLGVDDKDENLYAITLYATTGLAQAFADPNQLSALQPVQRLGRMNPAAAGSASEVEIDPNYADFWAHDDPASMANPFPTGPRNFRNFLQFHPTGQVKMVSEVVPAPGVTMVFRGNRRAQHQLAAIGISRLTGKVHVRLL